MRDKKKRDENCKGGKYVNEKCGIRQDKLQRQADEGWH